MRCATESGTGTSVGGGAVVWTYANGTGDVKVKRVSSSRGTDVYVVFFLLYESGRFATQLDTNVTMAFNDPTSVTVTGCSSNPTLINSIQGATYKAFYYTLLDCPNTATVSASATAVATNTDTSQQRTINGSGTGGGADNGSGSFDGWTKQVVFVTSTQHDGDFNGLSGMDTYCQVIAASAPLVSGEPGVWMAIASDTNSSAFSRINLSTSLPLKNTQGETVVNTASALWGGSLVNSIHYDETGIPPIGGAVFTGTTGNGSSDSANCLDWNDNTFVNSSYIGTSSKTNSEWVKDTISTPCLSSASVYCINMPVGR